MNKGQKPTPAGQLVKQLLTLFPNTPTLTLAKKAYALHPEMWTNVEAARGMIRFCRGASGKQSHRHGLSKRPFSKDLFNPFKLPESDEAEYLPFILPSMVTKILWMSDVHVPRQAGGRQGFDECQLRALARRDGARICVGVKKRHSRSAPKFESHEFKRAARRQPFCHVSC